MARHKKNEAHDSDDLQQDKLLVSTTIRDADGYAYAFTLRAHSVGIMLYEYKIGIKDVDALDERFGFWVDLRVLQELIACFAKATLSVKKHEDYLRKRSRSNA